MPNVEDSVTTLVRLLDNNMRLVKDDGSMGSVYVSKEWFDRDFMKTYDAQVTVGLSGSIDRKIGFSGSKRLTVDSPRVNVWVVEKSGSVQSARRIRDKMRQEIKRIIREKRTKPNITEYTFWNLGTNSTTHKAYEATSDSEYDPEDAGWSEIEGVGYNKIWYSDDDRHSNSADVNLEYALLLFRFKIAAKPDVLTKLELTFEGYGTAPSGNGATIKVWNFTSESWENAESGTEGTDETITISLTSDFADFVDADGYVYLLARTTNPSDGSTPAVIYCDYVECSITVQGITYVDVVSHRDNDQVDVKPIIWRTEFLLKTWLFETVPVT
ncbi:MAG TPA: hypothetical protein ENN36_00075 [Candidatus Bathyarchaeota archaeon]|nr:hypothetical protein [Candidatus Bathyarchaeota archaeon]